MTDSKNPIDKIKVLYDAVSKDYELGTFDEFSSKLSDSSKRKAFYDEVSNSYNLGTYGEFESKVSTAKKERPMGPIPSFKEFAQQRGVVTDFGRPVTDIPAPDLALKAQQSEQIDKNRKTAIENTITKKLTSEGLTFKKDDATWKKAEADIRKNVQDGVLAMSVNNVGEPVYKRSLNPLESYTQALNFFAKKEQDSFDFSIMDNKERVKYAEKLELEEPEGVASEGISQIFESAGQMTLPVIKMIGGAMIGSTLAPGAGTIAGGIGGFLSALPSTYVMGGEQNVIRLYRRAIDELKAQGQEITEDVKLREMDKAMEQYSLGGTAQVAANVPLFRIAPAVANTFKNAVVQATKNTTFDLATQVPIAGVASVAQDVSAKQAGYNIKASEMFQNAWDMSSEAAKVIVALNVGHNMTAVPKYVASATKEFLNSMPKLDLNNMSQALEAQGVYPPGSTEKLMTSLESYDKARSQVPTIIPEEYMPSMAGLMEKRANLEAQKTPENKPFHAKIDEQIAAIDKRIETMQESPNPILDEVDDLTGDTGEAAPFTEADAIKASELELGVTPEVEAEQVAPEGVKVEPPTEKQVVVEPAKAEPVAPEKALAASTIRLYNLREQNALMEEIGDPVTMRQAVMQALIYGRKVGIESIRRETGMSAEKRRIKGRLKSEISAKTFATEKGESIPRVAEKIWEDLPDEVKNMYDSQDAIAELIDIVSTYDDIPSLREDYIKEFYVDADKMLEDYYNNRIEEVDPIQKEWDDWAKEVGERDMALELDPEYVEQLIRKEYGEEPAKVTEGAPRAEEIATDKEISSLDASKEAREAAGTIRTKGDVEEVRTYDDFRKRELARPEFDAEFNKNRYEFEDKEDFIRRKFCE